ncbi:hypothetical protein GGU10DRAFT_388377 [Lentinula aff. detonsa]|uniref:PIPK domain-containing protein n=1 Tax=Lentinula aff. detonsa TaxID=2804958 RepID=A0AA38NCK6_9AGAR|nr:hypothetical protein GGU10DRAFT_388377 [Lentinula aff. detonsa]
MTDHKPLPELPTSSALNLMRLTIQSQEHRERFIRFVLSELDDPWIDNNLEDCIQMLQDALDDFGINMGLGQWLGGIKKRKVLKQMTQKEGKLPGPTESSAHSGKSEAIEEGTSETQNFLTTERLKQLREVVAKPDVPSRTTKSTHLLLCLAPFESRIPLTDEKSGFNLVPSTLGCTFRNRILKLPEGDDTNGILYGLHEWDILYQETPRVVGGTFTLRGLPSLQQHCVLAKALKLSIFVHLSLLLEQQLLVNSHVHLTIAQPRVRVRAPSSNGGSQPSTGHFHNQDSTSNAPNKPRNLISNSILSFFSKRSLGRSPPSRDPTHARSLLDSVPFRSAEEELPPRPSIDEMGAAAHLERFSFLSSPLEPKARKETTSTLSTILARIEAHKNVFSTSAGVMLDPPTVLVRLAKKEQSHPEKKIHLMGDERVALNSLLGWGTVDTESNDQTNPDKSNGNENEVNQGKGMTGICGFINQQEISILVSSHVPLLISVPQDVGSEASSTSSALSLREASSLRTSESSPTTHTPSTTSLTHTSCERPHWTVYRYYANSDPGTQVSKSDQEENADNDNFVVEDDSHYAVDQDRCLGEVITSWIDEADLPCSRLRTVPSTLEPRGGMGIGIMQGLGGSASTTTEKRCEVQVGKHERRFVHGGVKISSNIEWPAVEVPLETTSAVTRTATNATTAIVTNPGDRKNDHEKNQADPDTRVITAWESCSICGAQTRKNELSDGAYLYSFAKYLELLIYSPLLCNLSPKLCEHTDPSSDPPASTSSTSSNSARPVLPPQRFNIVRHFSTSSINNRVVGSSHKEYTVSFKIDPVEDIFELRVPRLQIFPLGVGGGSNEVQNSATSIYGTVGGKGKQTQGEHHTSKGEEEKKILRREIKAWWEGVADYIDILEERFFAHSQVAVKKALPRLPSTDDAYDSFDDNDIPDSHEHPTPKPKISGLPENSTPTLATTSDCSSESQDTSPVSSTLAASLTPAPSHSRLPLKHAASSTSQLTSSSASLSMQSTNAGAPADAMQLLSNLRQTFHRIEQTLYTQLAKTRLSSLNEVRRAFLSAARGAERRLLAWQKKHLGSKKERKDTGNNEDEGRLNELDPSDKLRAAEPDWWHPTCHVVPEGNVIIREDDWGSIIAFTLSAPDYYRELVSMSVARSLSTTDPPNTPTASASSFFSAATATGYKLFRTSALVQPDPDREDVIWHEPEAYSAVISRKEHPREPTSLMSIREVLRQKSPDSNILSGSRFASLGSSTSKMFVGGAGDRPSMFPNGVPPMAWAKPDVQLIKQEVEGEVVSGLSGGSDDVHQMLHALDAVEAKTRHDWTTSNVSTLKPGSRASSIVDDATVGSKRTTFIGVDVNAQKSTPTADPTSAQNDIASSFPGSKLSLDSFTNGITNAMRLVLPNQSPSQIPAGSNRHHGLLTTVEVNAIDERPHIKYDWTIGKRLKFSCTVYFAKQFDSLRKRCGVDSIFLESLSRSANWAAEGGKSKSNFWKTADDRFIIKTLVNAWNVADLQVLIELSPSYFQYMESTTSKATVLAKLIGFYTIEIRNLETGTVQSKADLLVMENLFYDQKVDKTFDLKGIQGRKVKPGNSATGRTSQTLFDGEWIEGQEQTLTLVRPHSKAILREAIKSDADFLSKSNIMDYSLLLGVDIEHKQIACGLVDTIGSYTFAKTLEYKAKQGLNSRNGKEVTVMPPAEYQVRFTNALEKYFLACPDKWSRPLDGRQIARKLDLLPSVL